VVVWKEYFEYIPTNNFKFRNRF